MLAHTILWVAPVAFVSALIIGVVLASSHRQGAPARPVLTLALATAFVLGSSIVISVGDSTENGDLPALVVMPLLIVVFLAPVLPSWAGGQARRASSSPGMRLVIKPGMVLVAIAALLAGTTGPIVAKDALGLAKAAAFRRHVVRARRSQRINAKRLSDLVIPADAQWQTAYRSAHAVPAMINDGLQLLREHVHPGQRVFTLAYTDPFSLALGLPLSRCGLLWWDLGYDFDQAHHPDAGCAIGSAEWVIIPRMVKGQGCCQKTVAVMRHLFARYLARHYRAVARTSDWILMRRDRYARSVTASGRFPDRRSARRRKPLAALRPGLSSSSASCLPSASPAVCASW